MAEPEPLGIPTARRRLPGVGAACNERGRTAQGVPGRWFVGYYLRHIFTVALR